MGPLTGGIKNAFFVTGLKIGHFHLHLVLACVTGVHLDVPLLFNDAPSKSLAASHPGNQTESRHLVSGYNPCLPLLLRPSSSSSCVPAFTAMQFTLVFNVDEVHPRPPLEVVWQIWTQSVLTVFRELLHLCLYVPKLCQFAVQSQKNTHFNTR